jgi:hypothetical protein
MAFPSLSVVPSDNWEEGKVCQDIAARQSNQHQTDGGGGEIPFTEDDAVAFEEHENERVGKSTEEREEEDNGLREKHLRFTSAKELTIMVVVSH